jgi:FkbH-like protein
VLYYLPVPSGVKALATGQRYRFKKKVGGQPITGGELPTSFLCECYNPSPRTVALSLTLRSANEAIKIHFQRLIELTPGFHRVRVPMTKIMPVIDIRKPFNIELIPNDVEETTTLYFGTIEFVREVDQAPSRETKIKCVVWDLDNTLWDGILIEDGAGKLTLKPGVIDVIRSLDERGILQSIASKNSHDEAMQILKQFQIEEFFLCPQISWRPKSESIGLIAQQLNIGEDSLLFVDDSQFELDQVKAVRPQVRIMNALEYRTLPEVEACQVQVTAESRERRRMYQVEAARQNMAEGFGSDYKTFLRHCNIQLVLRPMTEENLDRVHELTQRTNQMNFSGVRYDRDVLRSIAADSSLDTYVISCEDRFGSYGIVGFSVIDSREPRMTDLMFSCRVQAKRIEHAFLGHVIRRYASNSGGDFFANYRKTARNAPSGQVFDDLGMEEIVTKDGVTSLVFRRDKTAPDDQVVQIADLVLSAEAT